MTAIASIAAKAVDGTMKPMVQRIVSACGIASVGAGYRPGATDLYREAILPHGTDRQFVAVLEAEGWHVTITPTAKVLR